MVNGPFNSHLTFTTRVLDDPIVIEDLQVLAITVRITFVD